jgi:hypothetical protein
MICRPPLLTSKSAPSNGKIFIFSSLMRTLLSPRHCLSNRKKLCYALDKIISRISWRLLPLATGRLVVLRERQGKGEEDKAKARQRHGS